MSKRRSRDEEFDDDYYEDDEDSYDDEAEFYEDAYDEGVIEIEDAESAEPEEEDLAADLIVVEGPFIVEARKHTFGQEWWGKEWIAALEALGEAGRLERGRRYARNGSVLNLRIGHGEVSARVQGSRPRPYRTYVRLKALSKQDWEKALRALAKEALYSAKLLSGEMPPDIEKVFHRVGLSLFPRARGDISFSCTCPDEWSSPCKHCAAVYYLLADQFDADPFVLFHLRGMNREQVLAALRRLRGAGEAEPAVPGTEPGAEAIEIELEAEAPPLDSDLTAFWGAPLEPVLHAAPVQPDQPPILLKLGDPPGDILPDLRAIYQSVSMEAYRWLSEAEDTQVRTIPPHP